MASGGVTQIDSAYLANLRSQLQDLQKEVQDQLNGIGPYSSDVKLTVGYIPPVNNLNLQAGSSNFDAGKQIQSALSTMGGSVYDRLTWLNNTLTDMISEITTTISQLHGTESLNNEQVDQLTTEFNNTIGDFGNPGGGTPSPNLNTSAQ